MKKEFRKIYAGAVLTMCGIVFSGCSSTGSNTSAIHSSTSNKTLSLPYFVSSNLGSGGGTYFLIKNGDSWEASKTGDLRQKGVERVVVNNRTIYLDASAPTQVSPLEAKRGPGKDGKWECYSGLGGNGYRDQNSYSVCSSELTKSVTSVGEAVLGSLNLFLGTVRGMVSVDQDKILAVAQSSGLLDMIEHDKAVLEQAYNKSANDREANQYQADRSALEQAETVADIDRVISSVQWRLNNGIHKDDPDNLMSLALQKRSVFEKSEAKENARKEAEKKKEENRLAKEENNRRAAEHQRVALFRKSLKEGDETNCGPVLGVKNKLVQISFAVANYGNEHWIRREIIFPSGYDCRFINGQYQPPQSID